VFLTSDKFEYRQLRPNVFLIREVVSVDRNFLILKTVKKDYRTSRPGVFFVEGSIMELNIGLIGSCSDSSLSSDGLSDFLVGCQILHEEFGLGTVRAVNVDTQRCLIQLDRRDVTIDCTLVELAGKDGYSTVYVKRAQQES